MIEEQTPPTAGLGQVRRCRPRPATVRFYFHCGRLAAMPRTAAGGHKPTLRSLFQSESGIVGARHNEARIDRKPFTANQPGRNT